MTMEDIKFAPFLMWNSDEHFNKTDELLYKNTNENECLSYDKLMFDAFFSQKNKNIIQVRILKNVFQCTGKKIRKVDSINLHRMMYYAWENICNFLPYNLKKQIDELDNYVANHFIKMIIKYFEIDNKYIRDSIPLSGINKEQIYENPIHTFKSKQTTLAPFY